MRMQAGLDSRRRGDNRGRVQTLASPTVNVTSPAISSTADRYWVRLLCLRKQNCFTRITGRSLQLLNIICVGTFRYSRLRLDNARVVTCKHHHYLYCIVIRRIRGLRPEGIRSLNSRLHALCAEARGEGSVLKTPRKHMLCIERV